VYWDQRTYLLRAQLTGDMAARGGGEIKTNPAILGQPQELVLTFNAGSGATPTVHEGSYVQVHRITNM
jgi:hypothetical protein